METIEWVCVGLLTLSFHWHQVRWGWKTIAAPVVGFWGCLGLMYLTNVAELWGLMALSIIILFVNIYYLIRAIIDAKNFG